MVFRLVVVVVITAAASYSLIAEAIQIVIQVFARGVLANLVGKLLPLLVASRNVSCYAQDERMVRLGAFECEGGSSDAYLATAVSGEG